MSRIPRIARHRPNAATTFALASLACAFFAALVALSPIAAGRAHALELAAGASDDLHAQGSYYYVWVGGKQVTSANKSDVLGDGHVRYNPSTNTLTLKNAKIKKSLTWNPSTDSARNDGIVSQTGKTLTVKLVGTNTITVPYQASTRRSFAIDVLSSTADAPGDIIFTGSGKLTASAARATRYSAGILAGRITVKGSANFIAKGAYATDLSSNSKRGGYGIAAKTKMLIKDKAKVTASGSTSAFYTHASNDGSGSFVTPTYGSGYTPKVKAGASAKSIKVNKAKPAASVYSAYKYVNITKAAASSSSKKPAKETITSIWSEKGGFGITYKKITKNCNGYQVVYSTSKNFKASEGTVYTNTVYSNTYTIFKNTKLTGGATYYVHVRALNKSGSKTYYGAWSAVKSVRAGTTASYG